MPTMTPTAAEAPADASALTRMTKREAFDLREQLREQGWSPVETATDFRKQRLGPDHTGKRTVAYFPEFSSELGGSSAWTIPGVTEAPAEATAWEIYGVTANEFTGRWTVVDSSY